VNTHNNHTATIVLHVTHKNADIFLPVKRTFRWSCKWRKMRFESRRTHRMMRLFHMDRHYSAAVATAS